MSYRLGTLFDRTERLPPAIVAVGLALLGAVAFLPGLGRAPFYHLVEGDQALVVQAIVYDHEWLLPKLNDDTLPSKPLLFNWLGAIASIVSGDVSEGTVRFPSAAVSAIGLAIVGALGRRMFGQPAGLLAAIFLLTTPAFAKQAREATTDAVLSFCLLSAFALFYAMYDRRDWTGWRRRVFFLAIAGGMLTKGPVGFALPTLAIAAFLALERDLEPVRQLLSGPDKWIAVLPSLAWYAAATIAAGPAFVEKHFINENYRRFVGGFGLPKPVTTLILPSLTDAAPWSILFLIEIVSLTVMRSWTAGSRYLMCWWTTVLFVFSLSVGKRTIYLMPLYPAAALLAADQAWRWAEAVVVDRGYVPVRIGRRQWAVATASFLFALVIVAATRLRGAEGPPPSPVFDETADVLRFLASEHPLAAAIAISAAIVGFFAAAARARERAWGEITLVGALVLAVFYLTVFPLARDRHKELRSVKQFGLEVARRVPPDQPIYFYRYGSIELPGYLYFYVRRTIPPAPCMDFPRGCPAGYYLIWEREWHEDDDAASVGAVLEARSADTAIWPRYAPFALVRIPGE